MEKQQQFLSRLEQMNEMRELFTCETVKTL